MTAMLVILAVGVGTYLTRSVFIVALANRRIPPLVLTALEFVAPAVLAALVVSLVVDVNGGLDVAAPEIAGLLVGGTTVYLRRNFLLAAALGMTAFWVVRALV